MRPDTLPDKLSYRRDTGIFRDLERAEVQALGKHAPMQRVPAGTVFYSPEQAAEVLFILKEGQVRLYQHTFINCRRRLVWLRSPCSRTSLPW